MIRAEKVRVIDASTAHRVAPDWVYGFAELEPGQMAAIAEAGAAGEVRHFGTIGGDLEIHQNWDLADVSGLGALTTVGGWVLSVSMGPAYVEYALLPLSPSVMLTAAGRNARRNPVR